MENLFYYFWLLTSIKPKQRIILSKMVTVLIDTYNCIFLTHFSLVEEELDHKDNILQTRLNQQ